jgi:hypothetical protein
MANCLEPGCRDTALLGSNFCRNHQVSGKPVVYEINDGDRDQPTGPHSRADEASVPSTREYDDEL